MSFQYSTECDEQRSLQWFITWVGRVVVTLMLCITIPPAIRSVPAGIGTSSPSDEIRQAIADHASSHLSSNRETWPKESLYTEQMLYKRLVEINKVRESEFIKTQEEKKRIKEELAKRAQEIAKRAEAIAEKMQ